MEECEVHFCDVTLNTSTLADVEPGTSSGTVRKVGSLVGSKRCTGEIGYVVMGYTAPLHIYQFMDTCILSIAYMVTFGWTKSLTI